MTGRRYVLYKKDITILFIGAYGRTDLWDILAHTSVTIMNDCIRIDVLRRHFVHTATTREVIQIGFMLGTMEAYLP